MKKVTFYYVRHGQTLFNEIGRMQGWCDSPLTARGIEQAETAKKELSDIPFTNAYSSTSERCVDTAHIVLEGRNIPIEYTKGLKEMCWGSYEGAKVSNHLEEINRRRFGENDWTDVGGENNTLLYKRLMETYQQIFDSCENDAHVLIVSHGANFFHCLTYFFQIDKDSYKNFVTKENLPIPNGYSAKFSRIDDEYILESMKGLTKDDIKTLQKGVIQ